MIIVGIIFLSSIGLGSNSSGNIFRYISNIEIVVIDDRSNGYFDIYEPYEQSFHIPGIPLDIASGDLNKSDKFNSTSSNKLLDKIKNYKVTVQACLNPTGQLSTLPGCYVKFGNIKGRWFYEKRDFVLECINHVDDGTYFSSVGTGDTPD